MIDAKKNGNRGRKRMREGKTREETKRKTMTAVKNYNSDLYFSILTKVITTRETIMIIKTASTIIKIIIK